MSTKQEYRVNKSKVQNDESKALQNAATKLSVDPTQLVTSHTEKQFVFTITEDNQNSNDYPFGLCTIEKSEDLTLQDAINQAMIELDTFEGNITRVEEQEDETHYVFTKVRG
jgi:hypothetical protein